MADKDLTIKIRTTGDPSGAKAVSQAINATGEASRKAANEATRNYKRMGEAAAIAAARASSVAVADTGGGRSWSIPGAGAVSTRGASGGGSVSVPIVAPSVAPVSVPRPSSPSGGGGLDAIAPAAEAAADSARDAAQGLDKVADSAGKIKADSVEDLSKATEEAGDGASSSSAEIITALDSISNEAAELAEGLSSMLGDGKGKEQAEGLNAAAEAAEALKESINAVSEAEAEAAQVSATRTEAQEEGAAAAEEGAEAEEAGAESLVDQVSAVVDALGEKQEATADVDNTQKKADEEEKKRLKDLEDKRKKELDDLNKKGKKKKELADDDKKQAQEGGKNWGGAAMQAAQFLDDAQYGLRGVMNNIPGVVQALGLGTGVAGMAGIAAVALNQLMSRFEIFGSSAPELVEKTVKELHELTTALAKSRNEAAENAEDWAKANKNGLANKKELEEIATKYKAIADNIKLAADARRALNLAMLDESDAELGFKLSEIELQRSKGQITDIEAEEQSQNTRRAYMKAQAELTKQQSDQDIAAKDAAIQNTREELEARVAYVQKMKKLAADLVPDKDFDVMGKTKDVAMAQLEELRKREDEANKNLKDKTETAETTFHPNQKAWDVDWEFSPLAGKYGIQSIEEVNMREAYVKEAKEEADKARLARERAEKYARESLDSWKKVKEAREAIGPEFQDSNKANEHISGEEKKVVGLESSLTKDVSDSAVAKQNARVAERALALRQRTEENLGTGKLAGMRQSKEEEERQKLDKEREYREQLQDEKDSKMWDEMEKKAAAERKALEEDAARRKVKLPEELEENSISVRRKKFEDDKATRRRQEARARELALEKEKQDRLSDTIQDGDQYKKPTDRSAPVRPGFPVATIPSEIDRPSPLPPNPQITETPVPMPGDETLSITGPLDAFLARKSKGASSIGGGDPRLNALKSANDALKDGGTGPEIQKLIEAIKSLENTILLSKKEDREQIKKVTAEVGRANDRIKKARY